MSTIVPGFHGVCWNFVRTGHHDAAFDQLRRVLGAFVREDRWPHVKVGYSADPDRRWYGYKTTGWSVLVPVYRTHSLRYAQNMERSLIHHLRRCTATDPWVYNQVGGRNGRIAKNAEFYFTYLALGRAYARLDYSHRE